MSGPLVSASAAFVAKNSRIPPYAIEQSLRFDGSEYIDYSGTEFGNEIGTYSFWVKRSELGVENTILWNTRVGGHWGFRFNGNNTFTLFKTASGIDSSTNTTAVFRDTSAWYHILVTTTSSANEIFVNGTSLATGSYEWAWIDANPRIGYRSSTSNFHGYLAEWHYISGSVKSVSDFTETDDNGVLRPIEYTGSYGTNGYYLKFDPSLTNGILHDSSGQGNDFGSSTGLVTSGTGTDVMSDTPTTNYATLNPLWYRNTYGLSTLSNGNLEFGDAGLITSWGGRGSTFEISSGKWYMEWKCTDASGQSLVLAVLNTGHYGLEHFMVQNPQIQTGCWGPQENGSSRWIILNGTQTTSGAPYYDTLNGQIVGIAIDADAGTATWYRNGTAITALTDIDISASSKDAWVVMGITSNGSGTSFVANFGQRAFEQTPPTGYSAWNTSNLPAPTVKDGSDNFNTVLYSGNGTSQNLTVGFQPDWIWTKPRNAVGAHVLVDAVRGNTKFLESNSTGVEQTRTGNDGVTSFDTNGYSIGSSADWNASGETFVSWNWLAGNGTSSNTDGSITSTVSANPTAGFSIVSYTGTGANATVGHGLGVAPKMIIAKDRDASVVWAVHHSDISINNYLRLNTDDPEVAGNAVWNQTAPTSTVFSIGTSTIINNTNDYIAYCFAEVEGYSKISSWTGNGNDDGVYIHCGFSPSFIMFKRTDTTDNWVIFDTARTPNNVVQYGLFPDLSLQENYSANYSTDILSNGFKLRTQYFHNISGGNYVFIAFASNPFGGSGVNPATAR